MARSTFEGPILSGDSRFGPLRNVGYTQLNQYCDLDFSVTTNGSVAYGGASGQFVNGNGIPNTNAVVYTPSSSTYPSVAATIPTDTDTLVLRGAVFYLPTGCDLDDFLVDVGVLATVAGGTAAISSQTVYISNNYNTGTTPAYGATGAISAVGRQAVTFTAAQLANQTASSTDILQGNGQPNISQVVMTIAIVGTNLNSRTSLTGKYYLTTRYTQPDNNIGNTTTYPYGNLD